MIQRYPGQLQSFALMIGFPRTKLRVVMTSVTERALAAFPHGDVSRYLGNGGVCKFEQKLRDNLPYSVMDSGQHV